MSDDLDVADVAAEILGTTPEKADTPSEAIDFAARAAAAESELLAADPEEGKGSPTGQDKEKQETKTETSAEELDPVNELIKSKYKGDKKAFIDGLHESWKSNAQMAKRLEELEEKLANSSEESTPVKSPDLDLLSQEIADFEEDIKANEEKKSRLVARGSEIKEKISELKGEKKRADELDAKEIEKEIQTKSDLLDDLLEKWEALRDKNKKLNLEKAKATRKLDLLKETLEESKKSNNNSSKEQTKVAEQRVLDEFEHAILSEMKENKLSVDDGEEVAYFYNLVKAEITHYLRTLPKDHPEYINGTDIPAFVKKSMAVHAKRLGKGSLEKLTKEKLNASGSKATTNTPNPQPNKFVPKSDKAWDLKFAKARAAKILG